LITVKNNESGKLTPKNVILMLLGIIFIAATLRAPFTSVGPLINIIREDTGISNTLAGLLTTLPLIAFAVCSSLAPKVALRIGVEYTLFAGLLILTLGILLRSVPLFAGLLFGTILIGIAIAMGNVLLPGLIKREFPAKSGLMTGVYAIVMNLSAAIGSGISVSLAQKEAFGWRGSLISWSVISVIAIVVWLPQLRSRHKSEAYIDGKADRESGRLWKSSLAWQVTLFMGLQSFAYYILAAWLPEMLQAQGMNNSHGGWMLSLLQFSTLPASFLTPVLAVRFRSQRVLGAMVGALFLIGFLGLISGPLVLVPLWMILMGLAGGSAISLALLLFGLRTENSHQAAELSGMAQSIGYLFAATGPILIGLIYDVTQQWIIPQLILTAVSILIIFFGIKAGQNQVVYFGERNHSVKVRRTHEQPTR
jgi:CP family cyanate transporter-like MFS transporter